MELFKIHNFQVKINTLQIYNIFNYIIYNSTGIYTFKKLFFSELQQSGSIDKYSYLDNFSFFI